MKTFLFAVAMACAAGGLVLSACGIGYDLYRWYKYKKEKAPEDE